MVKFIGSAVNTHKFWTWSILGCLLLSSCRSTTPETDFSAADRPFPEGEPQNPQAQAPDVPSISRSSNFPIPSTWRGLADVQVAGQGVSVPIVLTFDVPKHDEQNPFYFGIAAGNSPEQAGAAFFTSSANTIVATGNGVLGLQFLTIQPTNKGFKAVLTSTEKELSSAMNTFSGPNVAAQQGGILSEIPTGVSGANDLYIFNEGAIIDVEFQGDTLFGTIQGNGFSALWNTSGIPYEATFQVIQD